MNAKEIVKKYAAGVRDFKGLNLSELNLSGANLSGANLSEANLSVANLSGANLSCANLSRAKLNVARLSGANLSKANLVQASLNVANLIRTDLRQANLAQASLIRAELIRAELSQANLKEANLNGADLREAALRQAKLSRASLNEANLRGASLTATMLNGANLNKTDLSRANLSEGNLREAELRQANLSCANLSGADLSRANLRWADLSGADLRWANLSEAKLSGANLIGADLSNANLHNASLVHADLTQTSLIKVDWIGADLSGATLTGAKLYAVSRFGLKTMGITCEWVDLSPQGDRSEIYHLSNEGAQKFFNQTQPKVRIIVDAPLDLDANYALASSYYQITHTYPALKKAPSIDVGTRKTTITFSLDSNADLFILAYFAILPFKDAPATHQNILAIVNTLESQELATWENQEQTQVKQLMTNLHQVIDRINAIDPSKLAPRLMEPIDFFQAATNTVMTNSKDQSLSIYHHPAFGKSWMRQSGSLDHSKASPVPTPEPTLPSIGAIAQFIKAFAHVTQSR
jgi:uncharacterized protein YjbI with pentapeptide repeats